MSEAAAAPDPPMLAQKTSPFAAPAPVSDARRLKLIDALRGIALLGILLINIPLFALPTNYSESFRADPSNINFWVSNVISVLFEGKMRALFGMLFGAGVLLFVSKKEQTGKSVTWLFYRRMLWLVLFGLIHAHLILWIGDILYLYGLCGMLVYLLRNWNPRYLVLIVALIAIADFGTGVIFYKFIRGMRIAYVEAKAAESQGKELTEEQTTAIAGWREIEKNFLPNEEDAKEITRQMKGTYSEVGGYLRPLALWMETLFVPLMLWDSMALMLLGMALYRWGFFSGSWSNQRYWLVLLVGYGIGLPIVIYSEYFDFMHFPTIEAKLRHMEETPLEWKGIIYPFQRILLVLAHASTVVLLYKANFFRLLFRSLEAVGQMAFTNYIIHSVICTLIFFGYGLNYYAELEFYQLYFVVLGIWIVQLLVSPIWLHYFNYGPLEWLWRSLTYWRIQPFRRNTEKVAPAFTA